MNIRDLIAEGKSLETKEIKEDTKIRKKTEITYETVLENDSDFVIERKTSTTDKMLVCILSQGLLYLKDVKTGELKNGLSEKDILNFLSECNMNCYPKTLKYPIILNTVHLSDYLNWAIKNLDIVKELVNDKIFVRLNHYNFHNEFIDMNSDKLKDLKWCVKFLDGFPDTSWDYASYLYSTYTWLHTMEKLNCNRDKIMYNKAKMIQCNFDEFKHYNCRHNTITEIIRIGNLDFNNFTDYLCKLFNFEFLSIKDGYTSSIFSLTEYLDYFNMQIEMYGKIREKYPNNWLSSLKIMKGKYNIWKKLHEDERFLNITKQAKDLEYDNGEYCIIVPEKASEVVDEGSQLGHCVASYVNNILEKKTLILFMRKSNKKDESLVTIEYKNDIVCQYKGFADRAVTEKENSFIEEWCKVKGLDKSERG